MGDKVVVTGSCGFVGPFIIEELLNRGYEVVASDLPEANYSNVERLDCEIRPADLLDLEQARTLFKGADMVVHTAARMNYYLEREEYLLANYHVTVNACEGALANGVGKFVHFSTCDTYGPPRQTPVWEDHPQRPINLYSITKLFGEQAALRFYRENGLPVSVIRPTTIYGPRCVYVMGLFLALPVMLKEAGLDFVLLPRKGFLGNLVHVSDIAGATVFVMESADAVGEAYNVSDDSTMEAGELMQVILDSVGIRSRRILPVSDRLVSLLAMVGAHLPRAFFDRVTYLLQKSWDRVVIKHGLVPMLQPRFDPGFTAFGRGDYDFDNSKLKGLGYRLRYPDFKQGWNESVGWYVDQGWIPAL